MQLPLYTDLVRSIEHGLKADFGELQDFNDHVRNRYFDTLHVLFFDFLNLVGYRDKAQYFLDALHPKEDISLAVLAAMAADPRFSALLPKLDIAAIREKLAQQLSQEHNDLYPHEY